MVLVVAYSQLSLICSSTKISCRLNVYDLTESSWIWILMNLVTRLILKDFFLFRLPHNMKSDSANANKNK